MNVAAIGGAVIGDLPATGLDKEYFLIRGCFIDARGGFEAHLTTTWGFGVKVLTQTHDISDGKIGQVVSRKVIVKEGAWIGSFSLLYNCIICENSIVAAGSVVRNCEVGQGVMVAGNPVQVIARLKDGKWQYIEDKWRKLE